MDRSPSPLARNVARLSHLDLPGHAARTVVEMAWGGISNGELLARAAHEFDALITVDKNLQYQSAP